MIALILISQILIQVIVQYEHSTEGYAALLIALVFSVALAQARWSAIWAKYDALDMRLEKLEKKEDKGNGNTRKHKIKASGTYK